MQVNRVVPSGFCEGVQKAISLAKKARLDHPDKKVYILGHLVHNHMITKSLALLDIITLDDKDRSKEELIDSIDDGVVIFSAHGISDAIKDKAIAKGLIVYDATCSYVLKTKELIKEKLAAGYDVLYIGKANHPEAMAILSLDERITLIESESDIEKLPLDLKVFATNQTTMSIIEIKNILEAIKKRYPDAQVMDEVCNATRLRQEAILKIKDADLLYVVGDPASNNSNKLKDIAIDLGIKKVSLINSAQDISYSDLDDVDIVYVTSGASTPNYLREEVISVLKRYDDTKKLVVSPIDYKKLI